MTDEKVEMKDESETKIKWKYINESETNVFALKPALSLSRYPDPLI